jgi:hypothetical protein
MRQAQLALRAVIAAGELDQFLADNAWDPGMPVGRRRRNGGRHLRG